MAAEIMSSACTTMQLELYLYEKIHIMLGNAERHRLCVRLVIISWIHCTKMLLRDIDLWSICAERAHFADMQSFLACQVEVTKAKARHLLASGAINHVCYNNCWVLADLFLFNHRRRKAHSTTQNL
jgi:hypothetical protein